MLDLTAVTADFALLETDISAIGVLVISVAMLFTAYRIGKSMIKRT